MAGWTEDPQDPNAWTAPSFAAVDLWTINNFGQWGQPYDPNNTRFRKDFHPDFAKLSIRVSQDEVMKHGYGKGIEVGDFPFVRKFLESPPNVVKGVYTFEDLFRLGYASKSADKKLADKWKSSPDRILSAVTYCRAFLSISAFTRGLGPIVCKVNDYGDADILSANYVHGSIAFALMERTRFIISDSDLAVDAEIGALNDNFDFHSNKWYIEPLESGIKDALGPKQWNLPDGKSIAIIFQGDGKFSYVKQSRTPIEDFIKQLLP